MTFSRSALLLLISLCAAACGKGGGMDTGGGEIKDVRALRIKGQLEQLKTDVRQVVSEMSADQIVDDAARAAFEQLLERGLVEDVERSRYRIARGCLKSIDGESAPATASAGMNERGGSICFSLPGLARGNASHRDLLALAIHEHAHHLGYGERDALRLGETLAGFFAAHLFYNPRPGRPPTPIAESEGGARCFDLGTFVARVKRKHLDHEATAAIRDISVLDAQAPEWFIIHAADYYEEPVTMAARELLETLTIYQEGCERLIVNRDGELTPFRIVEHTEKRIRFEGSLSARTETYRETGQSISLPDSDDGSTLVVERFIESKALRECREDSELPTESLTGRLSVKATLTFSEFLPTAHPMTQELLGLIFRARSLDSKLREAGCSVSRDYTDGP